MHKSRLHRAFVYIEPLFRTVDRVLTERPRNPCFVEPAVPVNNLAHCTRRHIRVTRSLRKTIEKLEERFDIVPEARRDLDSMPSVTRAGVWAFESSASVGPKHRVMLPNIGKYRHSCIRPSIPPDHWGPCDRSLLAPDEKMGTILDLNYSVVIQLSFHKAW